MGTLTLNGLSYAVVRITLTDRKRKPLIYAAASLNSSFSTLYFRTIQPRVGKLFAELKITHLEEIPLPFFEDPATDDEGHALLSALSDGLDAAEQLAKFHATQLRRIRAVAPQVASAMDTFND